MVPTMGAIVFTVRGLLYTASKNVLPQAYSDVWGGSTDVYGGG